MQDADECTGFMVNINDDRLNELTNQCKFLKFGFLVVRDQPFNKL